eukprot:m.110020 g.110020  ORF g.110020 m.110020 type:complete len:111 (+) comp15259_c0_seq1:182-514(+)
MNKRSRLYQVLYVQASCCWPVGVVGQKVLYWLVQLAGVVFIVRVNHPHFFNHLDAIVAGVEGLLLLFTLLGSGVLLHLSVSPSLSCLSAREGLSLSCLPSPFHLSIPPCY